MRHTIDNKNLGILVGWIASVAVLLYLLIWLVVFRSYLPPQGVSQNVLFWSRFALGALAIVALNPLSWRLHPFSTLSHRLSFGFAWLVSEVLTLFLY